MQKIEMEGSQMTRQNHSQSVSMSLKGDNTSGISSSSFFPLFDQITKLTTMPTFISFIVTVFFYLQVVYSSTWPYTKFYQENETNKSISIINYETQIFWFLKHDISFSNTQQSILISLIVFIICSIWFSFIALFYHFRRRFIKWTLYPTRFIFEIISPIFLHPSAAAAGSAVMNLVSNYKDGLSWLFTILGIIVYVGFILFFYVGYSLLCHSPILCTSIMSTYQPFYVIIEACMSSVMIILHFLFYTFDEWVIIILQVLNTVVFVFIIINLFNLHFHKLYGTALAFSTLTSSSVMNVLMIILNFMKSPKVLIPIIASYCLFVALGIAGYFIFKFYYNKTVKKLNVKFEDINEMEQNYENLFKSLKIDTKKYAALKYLYVGLNSMAEPFIDFTLTKYILACYQNDEQVLCALLQILSFFPSQVLFVNGLISQIVKKRNLKFTQKFVLYQAHKIKVMRQSSIPVDANEKILQLRIKTNNCEYTINSIWGSKVTPAIGLFETIGKIVDKTDGLWQEGIRDYPNNVKFSEEYCHFLTECRTDFKNAIIQKHRVDMIEKGFNFSSDYAFRRFVQNHHYYLKKRILDSSGRFINKSNNNTSNNSGSSSVSSTSASKSEHSEGSVYGLNTIDFEIEMAHAKSLFSQAKLRMALYNALKNSKLSLTKVMIATAIISLVTSLAGFLVMNVIIKDKMRTRSLDSSNSIFLSEAYFDMNICNLHYLLNYAILTQLYPINSLLYLLTLSNFDANSNIKSKIYISFNPTETMRENGFPFFISSENYFQKFLDSLSEQSKSGLDVYTMAFNVLNQYIPQVIVRGLKKSIPYYRSLKDAFSDIYFNSLRLMEKQPWELFITDAYVENLLNIYMLADPFFLLFQSLLNEQFVSFDRYQNDMKYIQFVVPIVIFIVLFFPFLIVGISFSLKMKKFARLLIGIDSNTKEECKQNILITHETKSDSHQSDHIEAGHTWFILMIWHALLSIAEFVLLFYMIYISVSSNETFQKLNTWQYLSTIRYIFSIEITHFSYQALFNYQNRSTPHFHNEEVVNKLVNDIMPLMKSSNINLMKGNSYSTPIVGFDSYFDDINSKEVCQVDNTFSDSIHDLYYCSSATQALSIFSDVALTFLSNIDSYKGIVEDELVINLLHLANTHLFDRLAECNLRLTELVEISYQKACRNTNIFMAVGIFIGVFMLIFQIYASLYSNKLYHTGLSLVRRIPPTLFVANKELLNFVLNKRTGSSSTSICPSQSVIYNANDGMVGVNIDGTIEMINKGLTNILGFTPEQLLGQPVTEIFTNQSGEQVSTQMIAMTNGEASLINEDHFTCISDSRKEIPCHIYIIGLKGKTSRLDSYAFLIQDESSLVEQQTIAEKAKAQSEALLFQILPRSIVTKLNRGEHDISFTVPSASIIFTDIVRFSEYSVNLSPADVMGNLSQIFSSFDNALKKYQLLTKIKLIGDIYMAAAGLFASEEEPIQPSMHAEQTIKFGLDCIQGIEDNNVKLNSSLQLRIGVNSGGPLIAGVLGSDKPVFDIIGDPINVAARLQTTDLPGRIQIPHSTYELIANSGFLIEERGEVFLKGKGKTMAYFVTPLSLDIASITDDTGN